MREQSGIPYLLIDGRFENTPQALRLLGGILGVADRGEALAAQAEETLARLDAAVPAEARPRTYLARAWSARSTRRSSSARAASTWWAKARPSAAWWRSRRRTCSPGTPDTIITWDASFYEQVWTYLLWADVAPVERGRVFLSPLAPFGSIDRPPSLNRKMRLRWLAHILYPDEWKGDLREGARAFRRTWSHMDLSEKEFDRLLESAEGRS